MNAIRYFSVLFMTVLCLGIVACSNEDDEKKDKDDIENGKDDNNDKDDEAETVSIIGTWKYDDGDGWTLTYELKKMVRVNLQIQKYTMEYQKHSLMKALMYTIKALRHLH